MKKIILIFFVLFIGLNAYSQQRRNMRGGGAGNRIPQNNSEPTEQAIAKQKREMEERKDEYINNFLTTLAADEFQKQIIKQTLNSYYEARIALFKTTFEHSIDKKNALKKLEDNHFKELESLVIKEDMVKIKEMAQGKFDEKEVVKEKKKKKKRNKRKKSDGE